MHQQKQKIVSLTLALVLLPVSPLLFAVAPINVTSQAQTTGTTVNPNTAVVNPYGASSNAQPTGVVPSSAYPAYPQVTYPSPNTMPSTTSGTTAGSVTDQSSTDNNAATTPAVPLTPEQQEAADLQAIIDKNNASQQQQQQLQQAGVRPTRDSLQQAQELNDEAEMAAYKLNKLKEKQAADAAREASYNDVQRARVDQEAAVAKQRADRDAQQQLNMDKYTNPAAYEAAIKAKEAQEAAQQPTQ